MNVEPIIYTTLKQDSQQRHTPKNNTKPKFGTNELQLTKKELKHQKLCKRQHKKVAEDFNDKVLSGSISPLPWRWISGVLGVTCLLLMAVTIAVAVFTANSSSEQPPLTVQQEAMESLCLEPCGHSCPKNWVWFRCSCYYFSKEELTWTESQCACSSLNSSLINMNREEMSTMMELSSTGCGKIIRFCPLTCFIFLHVHYNMPAYPTNQRKFI
nr:killer cell lectin-like receptor subfamily E member 1 [Vicugna pacos]XP_031526533.1 killer cell lectin-like receptor subfamily E member 1 [Vicugna pacos]XP_031526534.1 killer cell lectin-like receptor subfamily E member 1 [Vicugna pacos]